MFVVFKVPLDCFDESAFKGGALVITFSIEVDVFCAQHGISRSVINYWNIGWNDNPIGKAEDEVFTKTVEEVLVEEN